MKKKWIIVRIETKAREFESKLLIIYHLVSNGYGVIIKNELGGQVKRYPKGAYLINSLYPNERGKVKEIVSSGNKLVVLDEEGLVMIDEQKYLNRIDNESFLMTDKFLCYGKNQYKIVLNNFTEFHEKIQVTGNPRINLLDKQFDNVDNKEAENIKDKCGDFILIVSNFSYVNMKGAKTTTKDDRIERVLEQLSSLQIKEEGGYLEQFEHYNQLFNEFLVLVDELSNKFPNTQIIVRPHPSEDHTIWETLASKTKNVKVIFKGNLTHWIKGSSLVIQNGDTSAIESLYLNKPCISYRPIINRKFDQPLPSKLSVNIFDKKTLYEKVYNVIVENDLSILNEYPRFKKEAEQYISYYENDQSVKEILQVINELSITPVNYSRLRFQMSRTYPKYFRSDLKKVMKVSLSKARKLMNNEIINIKNNYLPNFLNDKIRELDYEEKKYGEFTAEEINEIFNIYDEIYNKNSSWKINKLSKNNFLIY